MVTFYANSLGSPKKIDVFLDTWRYEVNDVINNILDFHMSRIQPRCPGCCCGWPLWQLLGKHGAGQLHTVL